MSIVVKPKKCKGINKAKDFNGCGNIVMYRRFGLCSSCLVDWMNTTENGKTYFEKLRDLSTKKVKQNQGKLLREKKNALKKKSDYEKDLQQEVNKIARLIDFDKGCISCNHGHNSSFTRQAHGGHKKSVGSNPTLRFNLHNIHKQCSICNTRLGGNPHEYYKGLVQRYGANYANMVEALQITYKRIDLTILDLKTAIKKAREIIREIEKGKDYTRSEVNNKLKIYTLNSDANKRISNAS